MRYAIVLALALSACAGKDTPPDAWVFRPPPGQLSLAEAVEEEWEKDPVATAYQLGRLVGLIGLVVLSIAAR